jgi:short-subunit dehydrogenase
MTEATATMVHDTPRAEAARTTPAVVVTGASAGIGLAIAKRFLRAGRTVVMVARDPRALEHARESLADDDKRRCFIVPCDVTDKSACEFLDAALQQDGLYLDVLVNNAGMGLSGPFEDQSTESLDKLIALNVTALTQLTRHALPAMIERGHGSILNIASLAGYGPGPNQAAYYASKAFVLSLSEAIAWELRGTGVLVCCVAPGPVRTNFHAKTGAARAPYRYLLPDVSPEHVASGAYRAFMLGQHVVVPSLFHRLLFLLLRLTPHPISVPITGWLLRNPSPR